MLYSQKNPVQVRMMEFSLMQFTDHSIWYSYLAMLDEEGFCGQRHCMYLLFIKITTIMFMFRWIMVQVFEPLIFFIKI